MGGNRNRNKADVKRDSDAFWQLLKLSGYNQTKFKSKLINDKRSDLRKDLVTKWGCKGKDKLCKLIDRFIDYYSDNTHTDYLPVLPLTVLVQFTRGLKEYCSQQGQILTEKEIEKIFHRHRQLTRDERQLLGLPVDMASYVRENSFEFSPAFDLQQQETLCNYQDLANLKETVKCVVKNELKNPTLAANNDYIEGLTPQIEDLIKSIEVQSGYHNLSQLKNIVIKEDKTDFDNSLDKQYWQIFPPAFIRNLIKTVIFNQQLSDKFSLKLEHIEVKKQLFQSVESSDNQEIINDELLRFDPYQEDIEKIVSTLKSKHSYIVKIQFSLEDGEHKIDFSEEVKGTSSIISLIRKALNRALFWDIECWKPYYPIVQEVHLQEKTYGMDTVATCKCLSRIRAVEIDDVQTLLNEEKYYKPCPQEFSDDTNDDDEFKPADFECYLEGSDIVEGTYCGFDLIEAIAQSGFYARLNLLQELNINPHKYKRELKRRIVEQKEFHQGLNYLNSYPFCMLAMENHFQNKIFHKYDTDKELKGKRSNIFYQAWFAIIRAYLNEGLYLSAKKYLDSLAEGIEKESHFIRADFYLCMAEYEFIGDNPEDPSTRKEYIIRCKKFLAKAEVELRLRSLEFMRIGELSQGNISPLFSYWARIYALKGRINLFFPTQFDKKNAPTESIFSLVLLGNGRIYSAMDGNTFLASLISTYQSWAYMVEAYLCDETKSSLNRKNCISWSKKLVNHALNGFQPASIQTYQDYQQVIFADENPDDIDFNDAQYGGIKIHRPLFLQLNSHYKPQESTSKKRPQEVLAKLVKRTLINSQNKNSDSKKYTLFGQHAAHYYFAYAMTKLGEDYSGRNQQDESDINDGNIRLNFQKAYDYFYYAFAIAYGGAVLKNGSPKELGRDESQPISANNCGKEKFVVDNANVSVLKSLYFHRIVELVDLARIFAAFTVSILAQNEAHLELGRKLLGEEGSGFITQIPQNFNSITSGQKSYNIHLSGRFKGIKDYIFENYLNAPVKLVTLDDFCHCRDERLPKIFQKLRGE